MSAARRHIAVMTGFLLGAGIAGTVAAAPLAEELHALVTTHPDISAAKHRLDQAGRRIWEARAPFLPQVRVEGEYGYEETDSPVQRNQGLGSVRQVREVGRFTVTQKVFDGFRTDGNIKSAISQEFKTGYEYEFTMQRLMIRGVAAYTNILRRRSLLQIADETERAVRAQLQLEQERVSRGSGINVDVLQAETRLQAAIERRIDQQNKLDEAIAEYIAVFDRAPEPGSMSVPAVPVEILPATLADALDRAILNNLRLKQSEEEIRDAQQQRKVAMADFMPDIDIVAEGAVENDNESLVGSRKDIFVGLRASWNIFNGFGSFAATRRGSQRIYETMDTHASVGRDVVKRAQIAWQNYTSFRNRQAVAERAAETAERLFHARGRLRGVGRESVVNLLNAETERNAARSRAVIARYNTLLQSYQLLFELGELRLEAISG